MGKTGILLINLGSPRFISRIPVFPIFIPNPSTGAWCNSKHFIEHNAGQLVFEGKAGAFFKLHLGDGLQSKNALKFNDKITENIIISTIYIIEKIRSDCCSIPQFH